MAYIKEEDYHKLANAAAIDLVDNKVPLNESVTKLAKQFDLNQDQICRLCEAANNTTFNHLFKNKTASDDRIVDFDIADPKAILGSQIKEASADSITDRFNVTDLYELPNEMDQIRRPYTDHYLEKIAENEEAVRVRVIGKGGDLQIFSVKNNLWEMPTGTTVKGENRKDAAARVLLNKTGLRAMPQQLEYVGLQNFRGKMVHTFEVDVDKLQRSSYPTGEKGAPPPKIEYRKQASFELRPESKNNVEADLRTLTKLAEHLKHECLSLHMERQDLRLKLASSFKRLYAPVPFNAFEKTAAALYAEAAASELNELRSILKLPAVTYNYDTLQKTAGYVDTDREDLQQLNKLLNINVKIATHIKGIEEINSAIQTSKQQMGLQ